MEAILRILKAAADPNRLRILRVLCAGPFNVAELTEILGVGQSTVSRHLRLLSEAGLVDVRRAGTWAYYSLRVTDGDGGAREADVLPDELLSLLRGRWDEEGPDARAVERVLRQRREATSVFFGQAAEGWDRRRDRALGPPRHVDRLLELVGDGETVVDLGAGTGVLLERLGPAFGRVIGIDASPEMLEIARGRAEESELARTELRLGQLEHLPLSDGEADTMVANLVLHHVADPPAEFREIRRGLSHGGRLVIADLEEHDDESFWKSLGARWPGFRPEDVREWLLAAGFESVRTERLPTENGGPRPAVWLVAAARSSGTIHQPRRNG
jgi:ArsR family transcriptional regulator